MFAEMSKSEILESVAVSRQSNQFARYAKGKIHVIEDDSFYDIRLNTFGEWSVKDCATGKCFIDIDLMDAIDRVLGE